MSRPDLKVHNGAGEIVALLEDALRRAKEGQLDSVALVLINRDRECWTAVAYNEDAPAPWSHLVAGAVALQHDLIENGV